MDDILEKDLFPWNFTIQHPSTCRSQFSSVQGKSSIPKKCCALIHDITCGPETPAANEYLPVANDSMPFHIRRNSVLHIRIFGGTAFERQAVLPMKRLLSKRLAGELRLTPNKPHQLAIQLHPSSRDSVDTIPQWSWKEAYTFRNTPHLVLSIVRKDAIIPRQRAPLYPGPSLVPDRTPRYKMI